MKSVDNNVFQCSTCKLHYTDQDLARQCEEFCTRNNACSVEITKHSIEVRQQETEK